MVILRCCRINYTLRKEIEFENPILLDENIFFKFRNNDKDESRVSLFVFLFRKNVEYFYSRYFEMQFYDIHKHIDKRYIVLKPKDFNLKNDGIEFTKNSWCFDILLKIIKGEDHPFVFKRKNKRMTKPIVKIIKISI